MSQQTAEKEAAEKKAAADKQAELDKSVADGTQTVTMTRADLDTLINQRLEEQAAKNAEARKAGATTESYTARDNVTGAPIDVVVKRSLSKKPHPINGTYTEIYEGGSHVERGVQSNIVDVDDEDDDE